MSAMPLFPTEGQHEPPARCPRCGGHVVRVSFTVAECHGSHYEDGCDWTWRRDAQIAADEPWPKGLLDA